VDDSVRQIIINSFLVLHFLGIASLLAGFLTSMKQMRSGMKMNAGVFHGAYLMLISGLVMAGMTDPAKLNVLVLAIKIVVLMVIFFVAITYRKKDLTPKWVVPSIAAMTILNIVLAVFGNVSAS